MSQDDRHCETNSRIFSAPSSIYFFLVVNNCHLPIPEINKIPSDFIRAFLYSAEEFSFFSFRCFYQCQDILLLNCNRPAHIRFFPFPDHSSPSAPPPPARSSRLYRLAYCSNFKILSHFHAENGLDSSGSARSINTWHLPSAWRHLFHVLYFRRKIKYFPSAGNWPCRSRTKHPWKSAGKSLAATATFPSCDYREKFSFRNQRKPRGKCPLKSNYSIFPRSSQTIKSFPFFSFDSPHYLFFAPRALKSISPLLTNSCADSNIIFFCSAPSRIPDDLRIVISVNIQLLY